MSVPAITRENSRGRNIRVPRLLVALGLPVTLALALVTTPTVGHTYYRTAAEAVSWSAFAVASLGGIAVAVAVMAWAAPRLCLWLCVFCTLATSSGDPYLRYFGIFWLGIGLVDIYLLRRQRSISRSAQPDDEVSPVSPDASAGWIDAVRLVAAGLLIAISLGSFGWYVHARADLRESSARAVHKTATVTDVDLSFGSIYMDVDGKEYEFLVDDASKYKVGSAAAVFIDPTDQHRPYGADDVDPDGMMDLAFIPLATLLLAAALIAVPWYRRTRVPSRSIGAYRG